jgi:hypothetical protein
MKALTLFGILLAVAAVIAAFFGLMFMIATVGDVAANRLTGMVMLGGAGGLLVTAIFMIFIGQRAPTPVIVDAHVDVAGDVALSELTCPHCGGTPSRNDVSFDPKTGATTITCPFCHKVSQLVEDPKW